MSQAPVTVAVVSWNTRELLLRCLRSLEPDAASGRAEVWIVDNGSGDGSAAAARAAAGWARVVEPDENLGFGRAVNLVARRTQSPWLACANADTALVPGALERMVAAAERPPPGLGDEPIGCVAPRLLLPDGHTQHSVYPLPTVPFTVAFNLGLPRLAGRWAERMCLEGWWDPERGRTVPWAIGAFLLLRREAFEVVGGFDERQWIYAEDLDLGWRLHDAGWRTWYEPRAHVLHASSAATAAAFGERRVHIFTRETYAVILRRRGLLRTRVAAVVNVLGAAARIAWFWPLSRPCRRFRPAVAQARMWLSAHREGLRPTRELLGRG